MRYDKKITIHFKPIKKEYNPDTSQYEIVKSDPLIKYANISDLGLERTRVMFGDINVRFKIIRILGRINGVFDSIDYDGHKYLIRETKQYRYGTVFYCYEK